MTRTWIVVLGLMPVLAQAQTAPSPAAAAPAQGTPGAATARARAPFDLTGYWVALVTDDWRYRMLTPPKGNADYMLVNAEALRVMDAWDPERDRRDGDACRGYGAAGIMRMPARLHVTWHDDDTLRLDIDAGAQTRRLGFGGAVPPPEQRSLQGTSTARWQISRGAAPAGAQLAVTTTGMTAGYLRRNGVPYSEDAVLTEYFVLLEHERQSYLAVTTVVVDPRYLTAPYVKTYMFKKQPGPAGWNSTPCRAQ